MNKRTRAIDEETYKLVIVTMKHGFVHEKVQYGSLIRGIWSRM